MRYYELRCGHIIDLDRITFIKCCEDGRHIVGYSDKDAPAIVLDDEEYNTIRTLLLDPLSNVDKIKEKAKEEETALMSTKIMDLNIHGRTFNVLQRLGVDTLAELCAFRRHDLMYTKGIGKKTLEELDGILECYGLYFIDRGPIKYVSDAKMKVFRASEGKSYNKNYLRFE